MAKIKTLIHSKMPVCVAIGAFVSAAMSVALCAVAAALVLSDRVGQNTIALQRYAITIVSSLAGALTASLMSGKQYLIVSCAVAGIYCCLLICMNWLFFDGQLSGLLWSILAAISSGVVPGLSMAFGQGSSSKKIKKYRFG